MEAVYKLGTVLTLKDIASSVWNKATGNAEKYKSKLSEIDGATQLYEKSWSRIKTGGVTTAAGVGLLSMAKGMVSTAREASVLKSNLASLDLSSESINKIDTAAVKMGGTMGIAREDVLKAAYDIKSGIETIDDNAIGSFARSVANAAVATKGNTAQFASLFGTIYNQNKKLYSNLSDQNFGEKISNSLAYVVQKYQTEGSKMQQAIISNSGAAATAGYSLEQQFNVLAMLTTKLGTPGEAGTSFRAFVDNASKAAGKLGMQFTDMRGNLLPVVTIIEKLKTRYGETLEAGEATEIQKFFGGQESMKLIKNLWENTDKLKSNIADLKQKKGTEIVDKMSAANLNNIDTSLNKVSSGFSNVFGVVGGGISSVLRPFTDFLGSGLSTLAAWGAEHPTVMKLVGGVITGAGVLATLAGGLMLARGALGLYRVSQMAANLATGGGNALAKRSIVLRGISAVKTGILTGAIWAKNAAVTAGTALANTNIASMIKSNGITVISTAKTGALTAATWAMNGATKAVTLGIKLMRLAFMATPIGWIVTGIGLVIGAGVALYKNWGKVKAKAVALWGGIKEVFAGIYNSITGVFTRAWKKITGFFSKIGSIWTKVKGWFSSDDDEKKSGAKKSLSRDAVISRNLNKVSKNYNRRLHTNSKKVNMNKNTNVKIDSLVKNMKVQGRHKISMKDIEKQLQKEVERAEETE